MIEETKQKIQEMIAKFKEELRAGIESQRISNPDIKVISNKPRVFTISSSKLSNVSWDPAYYDYDEQFDLILDKLDKQGVDGFCNTMKKLVETNTLDGRKFNPAVIERVASIL